MKIRNLSGGNNEVLKPLVDEAAKKGENLHLL